MRRHNHRPKLKLATSQVLTLRFVRSATRKIKMTVVLRKQSPTEPNAGKDSKKLDSVEKQSKKMVKEHVLSDKLSKLLFVRVNSSFLGEHEMFSGVLAIPEANAPRWLAAVEPNVDLSDSRYLNSEELNSLIKLVEEGKAFRILKKQTRAVALDAAHCGETRMTIAHSQRDWDIFDDESPRRSDREGATKTRVAQTFNRPSYQRFSLYNVLFPN